jgi:hypothetical protein
VPGRLSVQARFSDDALMQNGSINDADAGKIDDAGRDYLTPFEVGRENVKVSTG